MHAFTLSVLAIIAIISFIPEEAKILLGALALMTFLFVISEQLVQGKK